jgi:hypothetical protein
LKRPETPRNLEAAFARRRSGVRILSAPPSKSANLQVKRGGPRKAHYISQSSLTTVGAALGEYVLHRTHGMVAHPGDHVGIGVERDRHGSVAQEFLDFKANRRRFTSPQQNRDTAHDYKRLDAPPQRVEQRCYHKCEDDYGELGLLLLAGERASGARINMTRRAAVARKITPFILLIVRKRRQSKTRQDPDLLSC